MITFDKLKLVADTDTIQEFNENLFEKVVKDGRTTYKFYQDAPYLLVIKIDYSEHEVVIEFTGKILGKDYPKLISSTTIRQCFQNINSSGVITLDIDAMMDADVVKCDVTKDILFDDIPRLTTYVRTHTSNYNKYVCRKLRNHNIVVEKNVVTDDIKKRGVIQSNHSSSSTYSVRNSIPRPTPLKALKYPRHPPVKFSMGLVPVLSISRSE